MNNWNEKALTLLRKSRKPIPAELNEIDWKSALSDDSDKLACHLSAFSNLSGGGFMTYGVNDDGSPNPLSKNEMDDILRKLGNIARNSLSPPVSLEHSILEVDSIPILFVHILEQKDKPTFLRSKDVFESYKRSAGTTVKMSSQEVKMLLATSQGMSFEQQIALQNPPEEDITSLLDYDSYFRLMNKPLPDNTESLLHILSNDSLISKEGFHWNITNLGALLFTNSMESFHHLKRKAVRVIVYKSKNRIDAIREQVGTKGYACGFEGLMRYIMNQLPTNEIIEEALRKEAKIYPEKAIREFVANALIHQDLSVTGAGVMIEIFTDRIEITNPGTPLIDTNRFIDTAPRSRNETLASLMRRLNICEERGSGIDRAIEAIEMYQLPAPKFLRGDDYTRVILYSQIPLSEMDREDRVRACYQHTCLHYVSNQSVNNQSVRKRFNISKNNVSYASKILNETIEFGLIKPSDPENASKKFATYIPFWA